MRLRTTILMLVIATVWFSSATVYAASLIGFEDAELHGGDNASIFDQYEADYGVTFSVLVGTTKQDAILGRPTFEKVGTYIGDPAVGFINNVDGGFDVESPLAAGRLGNYFMKSSNSYQSTGYVKLIIDYTEPVFEANGEIWDIDGGPDATEQWQVSAFDELGQILDASMSPLGITYDRTSGDGLPWTWGFESEGISQIEIEFVGTKQSGVGLAFDNFSPGEPPFNVPEPATVGLLGLMTLGLFRRKYQTRI